MENKYATIHLFHEIKNSYYTAFQNLTNAMLDMDKPDKKAIQQFMLENTFAVSDDKNLNEVLKFIEELTTPSNDLNRLCLLKKENDLYSTSVKDEIDEDISATVPILLTWYEKRYLKTLLKNDSFCYFLGEDVVNKLSASLKNVEPFHWDSCFITKGQSSRDDLHDSKVLGSMLLLSEAIQKRKLISCINHTKFGDITNNSIAPYRFMYSPQKRQLQLIAVSLEQKRLVLLNIASLSKIKLGPSHSLTNNDFLVYINKRKQTQEPLVLELKNYRNGVERCFILFSSMDKKAYYDEDRDIHILHIFYYDFEEYDIIQKILLLGECVTVISPERIRQQLIQIALKALANY